MLDSSQYPTGDTKLVSDKYRLTAVVNRTSYDASDNVCRDLQI